MPQSQVRNTPVGVLVMLQMAQLLDLTWDKLQKVSRMKLLSRSFLPSAAAKQDSDS